MRLLSVLGLVGVLAACEDQPPAGPGQATGPSAAYDIWVPGPNDTCTPEIHNRYAVVGPDGKLYPTWHPPVDPETGCTFGHEHGRDPSGSRLFGTVGPIPFGYANEQLDIWDPAGPRHEDHVGHKIEWENDIRLHFGGAVANSLLELRCDVLTKLHQGTHSKDAFTNNLHELAYHIRCEDGTQMHVTLLTAIGRPGEFVRSCDPEQTIVAGPPTPANSPEGDGRRAIPDRACVEQYAFVPEGQTGDFHQALHESWETSNVVRRADGHGLAFFNPYFQVELPSRYFDATQPDNLARPIAICYETLPNGFRAIGEPCDISTGGGVLLNVTFDDTRSAFDGAGRTVDINYNEIRNEDGPDVWYTDPFDRNGQVTPFPGSIRQFIAKINNDRGIGMGGPRLGEDRPYGGNGVHPPN
ncbi:MAG TPA: hypothetical protein VFH97_07625 [Gemmatimonadales bacterium]|nr:hypothetical protein [Gemmatimonadales bacterium]